MSILNIFQLIFGVILVVVILLQARGEELGGAFGGSGEVYRTKRGIEKYLFYATIVFALIFFALVFIQMLI